MGPSFIQAKITPEFGKPNELRDEVLSCALRVFPGKKKATKKKIKERKRVFLGFYVGFLQHRGKVPILTDNHCTSGVAKRKRN